MAGFDFFEFLRTMSGANEEEVQTEGEPDHLKGFEEDVEEEETEEPFDFDRYMEIVANIETGEIDDPLTDENEAVGAESKTSSASGIFQFTRPTWESLRNFDDTLPDFETMQGSREVQIRGMKVLTPLNQQSLRVMLGQEPTIPDMLLAHQFGVGNARRLIEAESVTALRDILNEKIMKANPHLEGLTVGGLKAKLGEFIQ